ncbi:MAG: hypothetical protein Q9175_005348 [Cornicularia normoerica]
MGGRVFDAGIGGFPLGKFLQNFTTASGAGEDDFAAFESVHAFNATGQTALAAAIITYMNPEAFPAIFKNLTNIQPYVWATGTFANNATVLRKVDELAQASFSNLDAKNWNFTFSNVFQPIPKSITSKSAATGGNVLVLDPMICMAFLNICDDPSGSRSCRDQFRSAILGLHINHTYIIHTYLALAVLFSVLHE